MSKPTEEMIIAYTAIFGDKDNLLEPIAYPGCRYVCFTDNPLLTSNVWEIHHLVQKSEGTCPIRMAKSCKILFHSVFPQSERVQYSLWIDGSIRLFANVENLIEMFLSKHDLACFDNNSCAYAEADECVKRKLDDVVIIKEQMNRYRSEGFPTNQGLMAGGVLLRRHSKSVKLLMEDWWREIENGSIRDQLSFNYVAWRRNFQHTKFPGDVYHYNNPVGIFMGHKNIKYVFPRDQV